MLDKPLPGHTGQEERRYHSQSHPAVAFVGFPVGGEVNHFQDERLLGRFVATLDCFARVGNSVIQNSSCAHQILRGDGIHIPVICRDIAAAGGKGEGCVIASRSQGFGGVHCGQLQGAAYRHLGWRDLAGCQITRVEAVFNGTTHSILRAMEQGQSYADALLDAQRRGIAEADPSLDVDGWDAACKLVITANAVLGQPTTLADVAVEGIRNVDQAMMRRALTRGQKFVLLCLAERQAEQDGHYQLSVKPTALPMTHPLARLTADEMGVVYYTDVVDRLSAASEEPGTAPAAAAMIRDIIDIVHNR